MQSYTLCKSLNNSLCTYKYYYTKEILGMPKMLCMPRTDYQNTINLNVSCEASVYSSINFGFGFLDGIKFLAIP